MCTAINYGNFFGRNLDWEHDFGEEAVIVPRNAPLSFRHTPSLNSHLALIGMAKAVSGCPLFFDAMNEKGLSAAGLNFAGYAKYNSEILRGKTNVASFEFITYILTHAESVPCAKELLKDINIVDTAFADGLDPSQLHFIIADGKESITVESVEEGLKVYDNPVGVLANNPEFPWHMTFLSYHMNITKGEAENRFSEKLSLAPISRGIGAVGLPGDTSSPSRFVRAAFLKESSALDSISQYFHLLTGVEQVLGTTDVGNGVYDMSEYSSAYSRKDKVLYYTTYQNRRITGIDMKKYDLDGKDILTFPISREEDISWEK